MKFLLTSSGLSTDIIVDELKRLVGSDDLRFAFIPTAANLFADNKIG